MRVVVVAGARPNFIKVAPIVAELRSKDHETYLVHTGQHYDARMSQAFFDELDLPRPSHYLRVGSGSHAQQTARAMAAFEPVLADVRPDWVVVVGDVNSTLACALVVAKLKEPLGCRLAHVEAGLRSGDWTMPEEVNRVLTDRVSDLLLSPSSDALSNLLQEGISRKVVFAGNVMIDTLLAKLPAAREAGVARRLGFQRGEFALVTVHRPPNVDDPEALSCLLDGLATLGRAIPVVFPIHPRTRDRITRFRFDARLESLHVLEPLGYIDMLSLLDDAGVVLTDSGGIQEETTVLGVPCLTLRERTERPVTIEQGTNRLVQWPLSTPGIMDAVAAARSRGRVAVGERSPHGWDGRAAQRIVDAMERYVPADSLLSEPTVVR